MATWTWITLQFLVLLCTLAFIYLYQHFTKLRRLGIPGPTPWPLFGNILQQVFRGIQNTDAEWFKKYGSFYGMYNGFRPTVVVSDIKMIKSILIKDFSNFTDRPHNGNIPKLLDNGLFFMRGEVWKKTRNIITPTFSAGKLKMLVPIINKCSETLADNLSAVAGQKNVAVREYFVNFTMDAIASTAFGLDIDSQKQQNHPFVKNIDPLFKINPLARIPIIIAAAVPAIGRFLYPLGLSQWPKECIQFYEDVGKALIEDRRKTKMDKKDFMQLLMEAELSDSPQEITKNGVSDEHTTKSGIKSSKKSIKLSDDEINGQAFVFFLAGYETTASFLRYASYVLALHPDIDEKLYAEIQKYIGQDELTYTNVGQLKYLDQFTHEVLRYYPPVPRLTRKTKNAIDINGVTIPKGASIQIPVWNIHRNPEYYENPDEFNPDRFASDKKGSTENVSFLTFGVGPRHCIGIRLALLEGKIALIHALRKVKFVRSEQTKVPLDLTHFGLLRPKTPIIVEVASR